MDDSDDDGSQSAPEGARGRARRQAEERFRIGRFRGLITAVTAVRDTVEDDRQRARERESHLQKLLDEKEKESAKRDSELSVQLRCAGRSYQSLLTAVRDLTEQLRVEEQRRHTEVAALEAQLKGAKVSQTKADEPWKEELKKRDLKIIKLQEQIPELEKAVLKERDQLPPVVAKYEEEIRIHNLAKDAILKENLELREQMVMEAKTAAEVLEKEKERAAVDLKEVRDELKSVKAVQDTLTTPFEKQIKELQLQIVGLQNEIDTVDYTPYEEQVAVQEAGYRRLVRDFELNMHANKENVDTMRQNFERVVAALDRKIQEQEREMDKMMEPLRAEIKSKDIAVKQIEKKMEELKGEEAEYREEQAAILDETKRELDAAKLAVKNAHAEAMEQKAAFEKLNQQVEEDGSWQKVLQYKMKLDEVVKKTDDLVAGKDKELKEKTDMIMKLQRRVLEETEALQELDKEWDVRVQKKEEGYMKLVAELRYAEGQIVEERERVEACKREIAARDADIQRLKEEHTEELRIRLQDRQELEEEIRRLIEDAANDQAWHNSDIDRRDLEDKLDKQRILSEDRVKDLLVEMSRRDRTIEELQIALAEIRTQTEQARKDAEEKIREVETIIRNRDRAILNLKNEIEYLNDSWEIKYNRLNHLYEKMQKKYEDIIGPGGHAEKDSRILYLKDENDLLVTQVAELKEQIKKQKRRIMDLEIDIDQVMRETADIILEKERGMAEMIGENAKLQTALRHEIELRDQLVQEHKAEKAAMVRSQEERIAALEQLVESLRFTDRQELVDKIEVWKKAYERAILSRDDAEDEYQQVIDVNAKQLRSMAQDYADAQVKIHEVKLEGEIKLDELDEEWKKKEVVWTEDRKDLDKKILELENLLLHERMKVNKAEQKADHLKAPDPELDRLRELLKQKEWELEQVEGGKHNLLAEISRLSVEVPNMDGVIEELTEKYEAKLVLKDKKMEALVQEHKEINEILEIELKQARQSCKLIEEQVRVFPNPFELEIQEMRDKYAQMQAGMQKMMYENIELRQQYKDLKEETDNTIEAQEENLHLAGMLLKEVAGLGALRDLAPEHMRELENALHIDIDGDGVVG